jgi:N-acetylglucosamine kinase-like BadF-type ATPase
MSVYVGLDCGGSSSRVLAMDDKGNVLFQGQSGAANLISTPEGRLRRNLTNASKGCPKPDYVCGCFAGLISPQTRERGIGILQDTFGVPATFRAEPDYTAALYASPEADVCVISGTGSLVCSRNNGNIVKSGGRGYILGDQGSGFSFGRDALMHFLQHPEKSTRYLRDQIEDVFGSLDESVLVTGVYKAPSPATILARLVKAVGHDAADGQEYAINSVQQHMGDLAKLVSSHVKTHHSESKQLSISLAGGVWKASAQFKEAFLNHLTQELPQIEWELHRLLRPPLYGAVELAKELNHGN